MPFYVFWHGANRLEVPETCDARCDSVSALVVDVLHTCML